MTDLQYQAVYNVLSFALASMMATTMYLWFRSTAVRDQYKSAVLISGLVTFIAAYHYIRIFNSWVDAHECSAGKLADGAMHRGLVRAAENLDEGMMRCASSEFDSKRFDSKARVLSEKRQQLRASMSAQ